MSNIHLVAIYVCTYKQLNSGPLSIFSVNGKNDLKITIHYESFTIKAI